MDRKARKTDPAIGWTLPFALALVLALLADRFRGLFDAAVELRHFRDRAIGLTTLRGVDASPYAESYVVLYGSFVVLLAAACLAARWAGRRLARRADAGRAQRELRFASRLAEVAAATAVTAIVLRREDLDLPVALLLQAVVLVVGFAAVKLVVLERRPAGAAAAALADVDFTAAALFVPFTAVTTFQALAGLPLGFYGLPPAVWPALYGALAAAALALAARWSPTAGDRARLVTASAPLAFIPVAVPLANELQYRLPQLGPRTLAAAAVAVLLGVAAGAAAVHRRGLWRPRPAAVLALAVFPAFLAANVLFTVHAHVLRFDELDYFHLGETTLPTQQLFEHGRLPLLDLGLTHTFSDMVFQTLYTLLNGLRGLDMLVWTTWVPAVLAAVALYFFLARVTTPGFALLAAALTPALWTVSDYYALALVPPLFLARALRRPTVPRFVLLWASVGALGLWRLDFGLAAVVAAGLVTALWLARRRPGRFLPRVSAHRARAAVLSLAATAGAFAAAFAAAAAASGRPVIATARTFFESYSYRLATRTRPAIIDDYGLTAALQYYVLPAVAVVVIARFLAARLAPRRAPLLWAPLVMTAAFSLAISVRSLERHSLVERFNPYLFALLAALLPALFLRRRETAATRVVFLAVMVLLSLTALAPGSFGVGRDMRLHVFADGGRLFETRTWRGDERRVVHPEERHRPLLAFFERNLAEGQTFFDFTNSPLLYVLAGRLFPTYVIPNLGHVSEPVQAGVVADLDELRAAGRLPFVVFEQGDARWDDSDGVPNEVRSYRVAEFVYRRYRPLVRVGPYEVWSERGVHAGTVLDFELERRELPLAAAPELHDVERLASTGEGAPRFRTLAGDPWIAGLFELGGELGAGAYATLELEYASSAAGSLQVFYAHGERGFHEEASAWVPLEARGDAGVDRLTVALPADAEPLRGLRLDPPPGLELEIRRAALLGAADAIRPLVPERLVQRFDLGRLPAVWGAFDPLAAKERTAVVATLAAPFELDAGASAVLDFDPAIDKSAGSYLHLRLRPLGVGARMTVLYGVAREGVLENGFDLDVGSDTSRVDDHLVRLSTQWAWTSERVDRLVLTATGPVRVEAAVLRAGD